MACYCHLRMAARGAVGGPGRRSGREGTLTRPRTSVSLRSALSNIDWTLRPRGGDPLPMNEIIEFGLRAALIGAGATLLMDGWALVLRRFGVPSLDFALLGRWIGHLPRGTWIHPRIAQTSPIPGERVLGWSAHYAIGLSFAALLLGVFGLDWARAPTLVPALLIGTVTVVAPLFILQPALGAGIASTKTPRPLFNVAKSFVTHTVYGLGLFFAAWATAPLFAP